MGIGEYDPLSARGLRIIIGDGGGGGGDGGDSGGGGGAGGEGDESVFGTDPFFSLGGDSGPPPYKQRNWIAKHLPGIFTPELWRTREGRLRLIELAKELWTTLRLAKPGSHMRGKLSRTPAGREFLRAHAASTGQSPPPTTPRLPPTQTRSQQIAAVLQLLARELARYQQQRAAERAARAQQRMLRARFAPRVPVGRSIGEGEGMPFSFSGVGPVGFGGAPVGVDVFGGQSLGGWSDVIAAGASALPSILGAFGLGEQEATEAPDILERLGLTTGLEGDVERTAVFWVPTASGVRAQQEITARNPMSGRMAVWRYMGRPVLYSGDLATCKRVSKVASRAARFGRGGRTFRRRRR